MKWKKKKQTENKQEMKEKKIPTLKVGTHKKSVIALWAVLIVSVSFAHSPRKRNGTTSIE